MWTKCEQCVCACVCVCVCVGGGRGAGNALLLSRKWAGKEISQEKPEESVPERTHTIHTPEVLRECKCDLDYHLPLSPTHPPHPAQTPLPPRASLTPQNGQRPRYCIDLLQCVDTTVLPACQSALPVRLLMAGGRGLILSASPAPASLGDLS